MNNRSQPTQSNPVRRKRPISAAAGSVLRAAFPFLSFLGLLAVCGSLPWQPTARAADAGSLRFVAAEHGEYRFDTGVLRGVLHSGGKSTGLLPVSDAATGTVLSKSMGLLSPYRILSKGTQHGIAAWYWDSQTRQLPDGAVEVRWAANETFPLDLIAVYRWTAANTADLHITVTARQNLPQFEVFVACYFEGFTQAFVYAQNAAGGPPTFLPASRSEGVWQVFPRDGQVASLVGDGRWQHPPHPVDWTIRRPLAAPLAMRRNLQQGLTALVMSPPDDCFAVYTPYSEDGHGSLYLGLIGRDVRAGQSASGRTRLVIGRQLSDAQAVAAYQDYIRSLDMPREP
jgi:hypothetical protein